MSRRLLLSYLALTLVLLAALEIPLAVNNDDRLRTELTSNLVRDAYSMAGYAEETVEGRASVDLGQLVSSYEARTGGRVVIVDRTGRTLADSHPESSSETFASRPEIAAALQGTVATGTRRSETLDTNLLYVAVPIATSQGIDGALRITYSTAQIDQRRRDYIMTLVGVAAVSLLVATLLGLLLARWVTRPMRRLERAAARLGQGDLRTRADEATGPPEVRELAHTFNEMADHLDDLMSSQAAFVADASHQLRTPLAALRLQLENLQAELHVPAGVAAAAPGGAPPRSSEVAATAMATDDVDAALAETARLARIVDSLLALARADRAAGRVDGAAARAPIGLRAVDLDAVVSERVETWAPIAADREVEVRWVPAGLHATAEVDSLAQVLDNLITNAIEATPPGRSIEIRCMAAAAPPQPDGHDHRNSSGGARTTGVEIHVVDEGAGLTEEERSRAFDRFWRASAGPSALGGTGLGLAIARQHARAMGGDVELRTAATGGVDAVVWLHGDDGDRPTDDGR